MSEKSYGKRVALLLVCVMLTALGQTASAEPLRGVWSGVPGSLTGATIIPGTPPPLIHTLTAGRDGSGGYLRITFDCYNPHAVCSGRQTERVSTRESEGRYYGVGSRNLGNVVVMRSEHCTATYGEGALLVLRLPITGNGWLLAQCVVPNLRRLPPDQVPRPIPNQSIPSLTQIPLPPR